MLVLHGLAHITLQRLAYQAALMSKALQGMPTRLGVRLRVPLGVL